MTAAAMFSSTFGKLCDGFGATDGELTMDVTLKAVSDAWPAWRYTLHAMPPHYDALTTDKDRRNETGHGAAAGRNPSPDSAAGMGGNANCGCYVASGEKNNSAPPVWFPENIALSEPGRVKRVSRTARENTISPKKSFMLENEDGFRD